MNRSEREKMLRAMETVARALNDEGVFEYWLVAGPGDGEIEDGEPVDDYYLKDEVFADMMDSFARLMKKATRKDEYKGAFYVDGILSKAQEVQ